MPLPFSSRLRTLAVALAVAFSVPAPHAQVRLPSLGESAEADFSVVTERRIGEEIMRQIRRDPAYLDDPVLLEYLQSLWQPLVATSRRMGNVEADIAAFPFEPFLVLDRSFNAFALPGGYIGCHLGTIALSGSADELASVLSHELGHITQRHIARAVAGQKQQTATGIATMLVGLLAALRTGNTDFAQAGLATGQALMIQGQITHTREMEREADRMGFAVMEAAGFAPAGMAAMFERLDRAMRVNDNDSYPWLRDHPLTVDRVAEARTRMLLDEVPAAAGLANAPLPSLQHVLMQARSRVLVDTDPQQRNRIRDDARGASAKPLRERVKLLYAGALASSQAGDGAAAERYAAAALEAAAQAEPREPAAERTLLLLQAEVRAARGDAAGTLAALDAITLDPAGRAPRLARAQAVLALHRQGHAAPGVLRESIESLQTWVAEHPQDAAAWSQLAASADAAGLKLRSLRAAAEAQAALGDLGGAIDRLKAGQKAARDAGSGSEFIEVSVIDSRLRELRAQRREQLIEANGGRRPPDEEPR